MQGGAGSNVSDYSHGTGFLNWWGWDPVARDRTYLTDVTAAARRGATVLNVSLTYSGTWDGPSVLLDGCQAGLTGCQHQTAACTVST